MMYPYVLEESMMGGEEDKHYTILNDHQSRMPSRSPLGQGRTSYSPVVSQDTWIPLDAQIKQSWELPNLGQPGQYSQAYDSGILASSLGMDLLVQEWLHKQSPSPLPLSSAVDVARYTETLAGSTLSPSSEGDVAPNTASTTYVQTYLPLATSPPIIYHHPSHTTSGESIQQPTTTTDYYEPLPATSAMSVAHVATSTTYEANQSLVFPTSTQPLMDNVQAVLPSLMTSTIYQPSNEQYATPRRPSNQLTDYNFNSVVGREYPHHDLDYSHDHEGVSDLTARIDQDDDHADISVQDIKKLSKQISATKRKTSRVSKKVKEAAELMKMPKSDPISRQTSCWRCRRYKKPCNGKGSVCDACVTSGFRIWSSDIGCRRGDMTEFILMLIPSDVEAHPITIDAPYTKPASFRQSPLLYPSSMIIPHSATKGDPWEQFLYKIQSTGIHGPGILELLQIAIKFQKKFKKPDKVIVSSIRAMSVAADIFKIFVATKESQEFSSTHDLTKVFSEARKVLSAAAGHFLRNCLTGKLKAFFPTFIASNINVFAYILVGDAINAMPARYRSKIWPDVRKTLMDMRQVIYPTARDLLNALSKGSQPLNMSCWEMVPEERSASIHPRLIRNPEGMRLVDDCEATFDAMRDLQEWRKQFAHLLYGDTWMLTQPLAVDLLMISSVSRLFVTPKT